MSTLSEAPWGDLPYDHKTFAEVVDDYVLVRGDLCEQYAREQLVRQHERIVAARVEAALAEAERRVRALATGGDPVTHEAVRQTVLSIIKDVRGDPYCSPERRAEGWRCPAPCADSGCVTPTPEPCRWTNGGAPACSETRDERYWCEPCRERREVDRDPAIERMIADPDGYYADARAAARAEVEADEQRKGRRR